MPLIPPSGWRPGRYERPKCPPHKWTRSQRGEYRSAWGAEAMPVLRRRCKDCGLSQRKLDVRRAGDGFRGRRADWVDE